MNALSTDRPTLRTCPLCRVAMLGSKSREDLAGDDTFTCLRCDTVLTYAADKPGTSAQPKS